MKAVLEFDLDKTEDRNAHKRAISATDMYLTVHEFFEYLRKRLKYEESVPECCHNAILEARKELLEIMAENSVTLDDLE